MEIDKTISRPALRYYGSQWNNAPWIVAHWPKHDTRVIPFLGGLNDELRAPIARLTNAGDLDRRVINFFQVLRDRRDELIHAIRYTPWHEAEYQTSKTISSDPLEDARRFWCTCWMSVQGGPHPGNSGFRWQRSTDSRWSVPANDAIELSHLYAIADRLKHIHFFQRDGRELIEMHRGNKNALIWCDPPFVSETRANGGRGYTHETDDTLHRDTAVLLHKHTGYALITGYDCDLYQEFYADWLRVDKTARTSGEDRIQSIWISPRTWSALQTEQSARQAERYPLLAFVAA